MDDNQFFEEIQATTFPLKEFDHKAHLRLAFIAIQKLGLPQAELKVGELIYALAAKHGGEAIYHVTVTRRAVQLVAQYIASYNSKTFAEFEKHAQPLFTDLKSAIQQRYSFDVFVDQRARANWIAPDLVGRQNGLIDI